MTEQELADARRLLDLAELLTWFEDEGYGSLPDRSHMRRLTLLARSAAAHLIDPEGTER